MQMTSFLVIKDVFQFENLSPYKKAAPYVRNWLLQKQHQADEILEDIAD